MSVALGIFSCRCGRGACALAMTGTYRQQGMALWLLLCLLLVLSSRGWLQSVWPMSAQQRAMQHTQAALAVAQQALLAYALQTISMASPICKSNCPRPGDLPCPDRDNDGDAESSCSTLGTRLGRLPWRTLGIGDVRDGSGERLWYAVSNAYKNNPRLLPLNLETPGSWSLATPESLPWDATTGTGAVAVVIAPMQPLQRQDGWVQRRDAASSVEPRHYLDQWASYDNATALEFSPRGFIIAPLQPGFNDVLLPISASRMHQAMQAQVLAELGRMLICSPAACSRYPIPAKLNDPSCLGHASLLVGQCPSATTALGRLPWTTGSNWPTLAQVTLAGDAQHHWFQQNGWREQVFYQLTGNGFRLVMPGEPLLGQSRSSPALKLQAEQYLEADTFNALGQTQPAALAGTPNDWMRAWP